MDGITIAEVFNINSFSLFGEIISEADMYIISNSFTRIAINYKEEYLKKMLYDHWNNMMICIKLGCESNDNFIKKRNEIFYNADAMGYIIQYNDKGDLLREWEKELRSEIEKGNLNNLMRLGKFSMETGSLIGFINGKKFFIEIKKIRNFFKRAKAKIRNFNEKAFSSISEFVDYAKGITHVKPWYSPIFLFSIILLVLFTLGISLIVDLAIGLLAMIYRLSNVVCLICTIHHMFGDIESLGGKLLRIIGL
jgi:hypothetical protein